MTKDRNACNSSLRDEGVYPNVKAIELSKETSGGLGAAIFTSLRACMNGCMKLVAIGVAMPNINGIRQIAVMGKRSSNKPEKLRDGVFIDLTAESFYPDGLTVDREGCIWSAMWDGWCIIL